MSLRDKGLCEWGQTGAVFTCGRCGIVRNLKVSRMCEGEQCDLIFLLEPVVAFPPPDGLGDHLTDVFASIGITKEKYAELKSTFLTKREANEDGCSGCNWRHKAANWIGKKIGLSEGKGPELQKLIELEDLPQQPVHGCSLHGKCLTSLQLPDDQRAIVVAAGYTPCHGCGDFSAEEIKAKN